MNHNWKKYRKVKGKRKGKGTKNAGGEDKALYTIDG